MLRGYVEVLTSLWPTAKKGEQLSSSPWSLRKASFREARIQEEGWVGAGQLPWLLQATAPSLYASLPPWGSSPILSQLGLGCLVRQVQTLPTSDVGNQMSSPHEVRPCISLVHGCWAHIATTGIPFLPGTSRASQRLEDHVSACWSWSWVHLEVWGQWRHGIYLTQF
jgi:hypothetical protein